MAGAGVSSPGASKTPLRSPSSALPLLGAERWEGRALSGSSPCPPTGQWLLASSAWREGPHSLHLLVTTGALGLVLGHPFDTVKVRLQTQNTYRGIVDCMVKTYRHESLLGFFKGMSFPIASIAVVNSVLFGVYSNTLLVLTATSHQERRAQPPSYTHVFIAGCTGGFLQAYCLAPFDLIKVRLQNQTEPRAQPGSPPPQYRGPVHCAASIFQEEGPRGLFRGAWALTLRDTPTLGIYFATYEWLCRQSTPDGQNPSSATVLVAGGFAGITSWVTATPLDVIKSRMQMAGLKQREYQGMLDCMLRVPPPLVGMSWPGTACSSPVRPPPTCPD
ncbi:solute carrier family 25 member 45 isoform 1-T1 [Hipposideros larvatus]|uniref:Solute carrier family 25 member 45 n=1 Tax=Hipposideros armiger TaxID=186990 RepID=A0A8B7RLA1_HIPAR|nr:PREDICTED: solute carrier family 25 member 45 isoform X2 [Hipposideros armiger]